MPPERAQIRPTVAEIDLGALSHNLSRVRSLCPGVEVLAVVKANAYGHGATLIARALEAEGVPMMGVALVEEGLALREAGVRVPLLVLAGAFEGAYATLVQN